MNKRIVQIDNYDEVELWAKGNLLLRIKYSNGILQQLVAGPMSLASHQEPGIVTALKEEGLHDGD
jgi:hypothetical protein